MPTPDPHSLPLADYDHLSVGEIESRVRSLTSEELEAVLRHERSHANRPAVLAALTARRDQLAAGAEPTQGDPDAVRPQERPGQQGGSPVSPSTAAPPIHPAPHGTPDQPARPKGNRP
ncbi:hypothetical protein CP973_22985 [Streptomyces albofaciens JCM 4342]|uniref:hypothetical protein n=1 Tax=Streptomyces albofaciens TaxID=66866 RepID=UPI00123A04C9|nr:hypothetical protein [Streptomyces albofaciens]KAA6212301.1 hypothetical protein CP973_22985 [Streptomyces albofaciens JCM 4342]